MRLPKIVRRVSIPAAAVAVLAATVSIPSNAEAQTGAKGAVYDSRVYDYGGVNRVQLWAGGWAVNPRTIPVQTVMAKVWTEETIGGRRQLVYTSGEHVANGSTYDGFGSAALPKGDRKYTFYWKSVGFNATYQGYPSDNFLMCYYAHDKGSSGGWTSIGCHRQHPN